MTPVLRTHLFGMHARQRPARATAGPDAGVFFPAGGFNHTGVAFVALPESGHNLQAPELQISDTSLQSFQSRFICD